MSAWFRTIFNAYHLAELRQDHTYSVSKSPSFLANRIDSYRMDIQVDIDPRSSSQILTHTWTLFLLHTWHGQSLCSFLKLATQEASQPSSSLQSNIHWPSVLLFLDTQASRLSSLVASLKYLSVVFFIIATSKWLVNLHCKSRLGSDIQNNLQCNRFDMDKLKLDYILAKKCMGIRYSGYHFNLQLVQAMESRLQSTKHSLSPQSVIHCKYWLSHIDEHIKLRS